MESSINCVVKSLFLNFKLLIALAMLSINGYALQCAGTLYVKVPDSWENTYLLNNAILTLITGEKLGEWTIFNLTTSTGAEYSASFILASKSDYSGPVISNGVFNGGTVTDYFVGTSGYFTCSQLNAAENKTLYIYEDPETSGKTAYGDSPPDAKYFYFLPTLSENWIEEILYIKNAAEDAKPMSIDPNRCGWYKAIYLEEDPPSDISIGLGPALREAIESIDLLNKFDSLESDVIFYTASDNSWLVSDDGIQQETQRCSYNMPAIIYDTDNTVNSSFFLDEENSPPATGIAKGIPQDTLVYSEAEGKYKMAFNQEKDGWTQENFEKAFDPNSEDNVVRNYDMPFKRNREGLWEFNSNKLCEDGSVDLYGKCSSGGGYMGGFFPAELKTAGTADYSQCHSCIAQRVVETWVPLKTDGDGWISQFCYDRGHRGRDHGPNIANCGAAFDEGDFRDGDNPSIWEWDNRPNFGTTNLNKANKNAFFCFESHSKFKYDPAHEFFFSGDDDIWIYIDNKLIIDLGGTHLAAAGYIKLSELDIELIEGETYPLDIFFCDRRFTMSNVRIASNIYFGQTTAASNPEYGLFLQTDGTICLRQASATEICGIELASQISYKLVTSGEEIQLDEQNGDCSWTTYTQGMCYGGISIDNGKISIDEDSITQEFLKTMGFEIYASVSGFDPLEVAALSSDLVSRIKVNPVINANKDPVYYNLKGEPLGNKKPSKAGVYIIRQNGISKTIVVR